MVYYYDNENGLTQAQESAYLAMLPIDRRDRALQYRRTEDRQNSILAFLLLRYGLWREYGLTVLPTLAYGKEGKPFLKNATVHFNLSHGGSVSVCALDKSEVGVDVQRISNPRPTLLKRIFSSEEQEALAAASDLAADFTSLWTKKEALAKATGVGIAGILKEMPMPSEPWRFDTFQYRDYYMTVCGENVLPIQQVSMAELEKFAETI